MTSPLPYRLMDSGHGRKLEQVGPHLVDRQAPQAVWAPKTKESWQKAEAYHQRSDQGGGHWEVRGPMPESWTVTHGGLKLKLKRTAFGHLGLFAEHVAQWDWMRDVIKRRPEGSVSVLNLFAYTGGATLAALSEGAQVCHVDAAQGVVSWARENAAENSLEGRPARWIVEDCRTFLDREIRRDRTYDALLLDPPTFGRGAKKEIWKIDEDLLPLLERCRAILSKHPAFVVLSCHSPGYSPLALRNLLADFWPSAPAMESGEMSIPSACGRVLPSGAFARFTNAPRPS